MGPNPHRKTQTLLLIQRLLSLQEGASPLNLVVDSLEQSAHPLLHEYIRQAHANRDTVVYISFEALQPPRHVTHFIQARRKSISSLQQELGDVVAKSTRSVVIIDSIHPLLDEDPQFINLLPSFTTPTSSLVIVYHDGLPQNSRQMRGGSYSPSPLTLLTYLATTVVHAQSLAQARAKHEASTMSRAEPVFGLEEEKHGVLVGQGANESGSILIEMEHRRKSGRAVGLSFVLNSVTSSTGSKITETQFILREEHPAFRTAVESSTPDGPDFSTGTFNLELTEKQRQAREGVVLPYFDAQTGGGQGGRILYEMDRQDDFDEEEDEI